MASMLRVFCFLFFVCVLRSRASLLLCVGKNPRRRWEILEEKIMLGESAELLAAVFSPLLFCARRQFEEGEGRGGVWLLICVAGLGGRCV